MSNTILQSTDVGYFRLGQLAIFHPEGHLSSSYLSILTATFEESWSSPIFNKNDFKRVLPYGNYLIETTEKIHCMILSEPLQKKVLISSKHFCYTKTLIGMHPYWVLSKYLRLPSDVDYNSSISDIKQT